MVDLIVRNGTIVTMNPERAVFDDGAVAMDSGRIVAVGPTQDVIAAHDANRVIEASNHIVLPGLINAHVHVADILARGISHNRSLHDWLFNIKRPIVGAMDQDDHAVATALYVQEALQSGITTFVENAGGTGTGYSDEVIETKLDIYAEAGLRNIYAHGFIDQPPDEEMQSFLETQQSKAPEVVHPDPQLPSAVEAIERVESLIDSHHGSADGRQSVWPAPYLAGAVSKEALWEAYALAEEHDVMTTTHSAESRIQERHLASTIERLHAADYLGERTLLGHCVHVDDRDRRLLATTGTKVAHNVVANLSLGSGVAPLPAMLDKGITVGLGTDNPCQNDLVNLLSDMRITAHTHKGNHEDPGVITAERILEMATIDGAYAICRGDDLGSIELGKAADLVLLNLDHPHLTPRVGVAQAIVYQTVGHEIETVICNGEIVVEDRQVPGIDAGFPDLHVNACRTADAVVERVGLGDMCEEDWSSISPN
jgi:cytosine/adenosine deaminase-related metal-dependent hydrolase